MSGPPGPEGVERLAIIGLACRFPGAADADAFWRLLRDGREAITFFDERRLERSGVPHELRRHPGYVPAKGVLEDAEDFDAGFFGLTPREAEIMDPQQRLFLECAWSALENAGYAFEGGGARVGVYAGSAAGTYLWSRLAGRPELAELLDPLQAKLANDKDFLTTLVSHKLHLNGPSIAVQTACSTSLVAVHLAGQSLLDGECDMALAGGVSVSFPLEAGYLYQEDGILSPDGHCRAFDARARGTVEGNGVGVVVLKRLSDALRDRDTLHAVVRASAVNNDGALKVGYTAPSIDSQAEVVAECLAMAGVDAGSLGLVEAHGSGTPLGDPIEVEALTRVFRAATGRRGFCALGSVKTNVGHLDTAAGVAGLIKAVLALGHREIPPSLHFERPNPRLRLSEGPFYVPIETRPWEAGPTPRRAGVSSLGIGGTNAHVVLEEAPEPAPAGSEAGRPLQLLVLSAPTPSALEASTIRLEACLAGRGGLDPADVAYTLQAGRRAFRHRRALVCRGREDALAALAEGDARRLLTARVPDGPRSLAWLLPGLGDHDPGMALDLYRLEPTFRRAVDACAALLTEPLGTDVREVLYPRGAAGEPDTDPAALTAAAGPDLRRMLAPETDPAAEPPSGFAHTRLSQPAVFTVEYALARLWLEWGASPRALAGYSLGEYVAACLAGVIRLEDALRVVAERAAMIDELPEGAMLAVPLPPRELTAELDGRLALAAANGPAMSVAGGPPEEVDRLERRLEERGIACRRLRTRHAFHSPMMAPAAARLERLLAGVPLAAPRIPFVSNLTGTWIRDSEATDPAYWARHLCAPVRFYEGLSRLLAEPGRILLEVGPGQALTTLARQHPMARAGQACVAALPDRHRRAGDLPFTLQALGRLWLAGAPVDWMGFARHERRRRVPLPGYPFERRRYSLGAGAPAVAAPRPEARRPLARWFYAPSWRRATPPGSLGGARLDSGSTWLLFLDEGEAGLGEGLARRLEEGGARVVRVRAGEGFSAEGPDRYRLAPARPEGYRALFRQFPQRGPGAVRIVHLWSLTAALREAGPAESDDFLGFHSLLALFQALGEGAGTGPVELSVISDHLHEVVGHERLRPLKATLLGPCKVAPQELPRLRCRVVDVELPGPADGGRRRLLAQLAGELARASEDAVVAWRGPHRWVRAFEPILLAEDRASPPLRAGGSYLVSGGVEATGLVFADHLARTLGAKLTLIAPPGFERGAEPRLAALEASGAEVLVVEAELSDERQVRGAVESALERFGELHGVLHAAASAGGGVLALKSAETAAAVLGPKVKGALALAAATAGLELDVFALFSSTVGLAGGFGQAAAAAASAFLDAFAHQSSLAGTGPATAIDWAPFRWDRWHLPAVAGAPGLEERLRASLEAGGITEPEAADAFGRALAAGLPQVVVCPQDLSAAIAETDAFTAESFAEELERAAAPDPALPPPPAHPRPSLERPYVAPRGEVERSVAEVWRQAFGLERVGVEDDFFELAGNSLLALQVVTRLRADFDVELPLTSLFEAPTVARLAAEIERARGARGEGSAPAPALVTIPRRPPAADAPLSVDQERLFFLQQLDLESPAYNIYSANRLVGALDAPALGRALERVVERHEVLRTRFLVIDGRPRQVVAPRLPAVLPSIDLRRLPAADREAEAGRRVFDELRRPFYLDRPPLFRSLLLRLDETEHVCCTVFHHIITDWVSFHLFDHELAAFYGELRGGRPAPVPALEIQYADFAVWQREWLEDGGSEGHLDYWRRCLEDAPRALELPADRPRPPVQTPWGARHPLALSGPETEAVRALARRRRLTLFITLLAVFKALLYRLGAGPKVVAGSPIANRNLPEVQPLLGFFLNHLVFATEARGGLTFERFLDRVREVALGAYAHQDVPFARLVEELEPERDLSRMPLTQVVFLFLDPAQQGTLEFPGLEVLPYPADGRSSKFDLTLSLWDAEEVFAGWMEYDTDLFDPTTVARRGEELRLVLRAAVGDPGRRLDELPLMSPAARHQSVVEWPPGKPSGSGENGEELLHRPFEARARRVPEAIAVAGGGEQVSYRELRRRARCLAARLRRLGAGPEELVGLRLERSPAMVTAVLGVLESGAALLPLDPAQPPARLEGLVADARPRVILRRGAGGSLGLEPVDNGGPTASAASGPRGDGLAYVLYTSGSSGRPKGVAVAHRAIFNRLRWALEVHPLRPGDRLLQVASLAFDIALWELFGPLSAGARLVLADPGVADGGDLAAALDRHAVTDLHLVPSWLQVQLAGPGLGRAGTLRRLFCGGETLSADLRRRFLAASPAALHHLYGPTEAAISVTAWDGRAAPPRAAVAIGRPISGTRLDVVDGDLRPRPIAAAGELAIGGVCLARGYYRRPGRTAASFVPDPFSDEPGSRLYRTGDRTRFLADGRLVFLGRLDRQVKVRGVRVEPGEIEAALAAHPALEEAAVAAAPPVRGETGGARLTAYVVPVAASGTAAGGGRPTVEALRAFLGERLPEAMVPARWVMLPRLPRGPHGKVDLRALPPPDGGRPELGSAFVAPRTAVERRLAEIWRRVLDLERVGIHDSFFAVGGDSILSIQIVAQARREGLHLTPRDLFQRPTLAELAALAEVVAGERTGADSGPAAGPVPLTPVQRRFFEADPPDPHHFTLPLLLSTPADFEAAWLETLCGGLLRRHDALRLRFERTAEGWRQHSTAWDGEVPWIRVDLSRRPAAESFPRAVERASAELQGSLDLARGPLVRFAFFDPGAGSTGRLLIVPHHLAVDGVSWRILLEDLETAYHQLERGEEAAPPFTATSFARWASYLESAEPLAEEKERWPAAAEAGGGAGTARLPLDLEEGADDEGSSHVLEVALDGARTRDLAGAAAAHRLRLDEVLLTALAWAVAGWTGQRSLLVELEGHGREAPADGIDLTRTVGWLSAVYPLRLDLGAATTAGAALPAVRDAVRGVPRGGVGYGLMRYGGDGREILPRAADPEIAFNYLGNLDAALAPDAAFQPAGEAVGPARGPRMPRRHLLEVTASLAGGRLRTAWSYSVRRHRRATVARLAERCAALLDELADHLAARDAVAWSASDFPLAGLDDRRLALILGAARDVEDVYPLTPIQQGMLYDSLAAPGSSLYSEQLSCELCGELDAAAFERSWQLVADRHAALRTSFRWAELDRPFQVVHRGVELGLERHDWRRLPAGERRRRRAALQERERGRGFDLARPPLVRLVLARTGRRRHRFVWTQHHLILDGWSLPLVLGEVLAAYAALRSGERPVLAPVTPYRDYVRWLRGRDPSRAEAFWRRRLAGFERPTPLPRRAVAGAEAGWGDARVLVPAPATAGLAALARRHRLTLGTLVQAAWGLLLSHYSGERDVVFGATVSGRPAEVRGVEAMVGLFINTLPVRLAVTEEARAVAWLRRVQERQTEARRYEESPFLPEWSALPPGKPLYESLVVFENYPSGAALERPLPELEIRGLGSRVRTRFPLTLVAVPGEELALAVAYRRHAFDAAVVERLLADLRLLLTGLGARPEQRVGRWLETLEPPRIEARAAPEPTSRRYVAPRTPVESLLAEVWAAVLGVPRVGLEESFFELGGHSLLATRVTSRLRDVFGVELPLGALFEEPTVAGLALRVEAAMRVVTGVEEAPLRRCSDEAPAPLSLAQEPLWLLDRLMPGSDFFNMSAVLGLDGPLDVAALEHSLSRVVQRHEPLRTAFATVDGRPVQVVADRVPFGLPIFDLGALPADARAAEAARLAAGEARRAFDLERPPLVRVRLLRLGAEEHRVLLALHHAVADGWSMGILVREVGALYRTAREGSGASLPELPVRYRDFARWQREQLEGPMFRAQLAYWRRQLGEHVEPLELPADAPRSGAIALRTATETARLPASLAAALARLGRAEAASPFMSLLAGLEVLLHRLTGRERFRLGTLAAQRNRSETEGLIGLFVNTLILTADLSGDPSFRQLLGRVREMVLGAFQHQDLPFEHLVQGLEDELGIDRTGLFEVLFILQNAPIAPLELPQLAVSVIGDDGALAEPEITPTTFDLIWTIAEGEDGLTVAVTYKTELFRPERIRRLLAAYGELLETLSEQPDRPLSAPPTAGSAAAEGGGEG